MVLVSLFVVFILFISLIAGLKEGAVKHFFNLVAVVIAAIVAGLAYDLIAGLLSFIPGENWENFLGFFVGFAIIIAMLHLAFFVPRKAISVIWKRGRLYRLLGAAFNVVNASIGLVIFSLVLSAFPIFDWLARWVDGSSVMSFIVRIFDFVQVLLPEELQAAATVVSTVL